MGAPILNTFNFGDLGKKLIESGALMEAGFASILQAESDKMEKLFELGLNKNELMETDKKFAEIINTIKGTEEIILKKIEIGKELCR